ncbi:LSU ribosomal protein L21p [hydrothermal vent metagenome]|uniref:LSU ribosomal protein L21p n=1 Tax=hydrothermal vent metagenome TaxID=652676 RepID=A0A3B0R4X3_9ZZZZ
MFAVIKTGGKQYKVAKDDVLVLERLDGAEGDTVAFDNVLMMGSGDAITIGEPMIAGATVTAELLETRKGKKIIVFKKKRRKDYKRTKGHRQIETVVRITDILAKGQKPAAKKATPKKAAPKKPAAKPAAKKAAPKTAPKTTAKDDLKKISGVGPVLEKKLNGLGLMSFADIATLTPAQIADVDEKLNFKGRIEREGWLDQAAKLDADK